MDKKEYRKYLRSSHWTKKKAEFKASEFSTKKCFICSTKKRLEIHHRCYDRLWNEEMNDLLELCGRCHRKVHDALGSGDREVNLWNAADILKERWVIAEKKRKKKTGIPKRRKTKPQKGKNLTHTRGGVITKYIDLSVIDDPELRMIAKEKLRTRKKVRYG